MESSIFNGFNPDEYEPGQFEALPPGDYVAIVTSAEEKETKARTGKYLAVSFQVVEGDCKGRMVWGNFNVSNPNPKAEEIGRRELADLCRAVGVTPKKGEDLYSIPLIVKVALDKDDADRNRIKGYKPHGKAAAAPRTAPAKKAPEAPAGGDPAAPAPAAPAPKKSPWKK